jgi:hypothetical protein
MTTQLVLFDYGQLDGETRIVVQQRASEIKSLVRATAENIAQIGEKLTEVRARLHNGGFNGWLESEFGWSRRTAYNFIAVYEKFRDRANFAQLDIATSALYLLAAQSTPDEAVNEALGRAESGERITPAVAQDIIAAHKPAPPPSLPLDEPPPSARIITDPQAGAAPWEEPESDDDDENIETDYDAPTEEDEEEAKRRSSLPPLPTPMMREMENTAPLPPLPAPGKIEEAVRVFISISPGAVLDTRQVFISLTEGSGAPEMRPTTYSGLVPLLQAMLAAHFAPVIEVPVETPVMAPSWL